MEEGFYKGKGFNISYCVTKVKETYELICFQSARTHIFSGEKINTAIKNFLNNHEYICSNEEVENYY